MEYRTNKIFISYSSDDRDLRQIFEMRLKPYLQSTRNKFDNIWTDKQIPIGSSWNDEIQQALTESNIGILLVSPMFLGSQYSMGDELKKMLERRENGYLIVPVILRECNFTNIPELSSIQFFKTYQSEYEVTDLNRTNKLMPFDELAEVPNPNRKLLNRYFLKLANTIDYAIDNLNNRLGEAKNISKKFPISDEMISEIKKLIENKITTKTEQSFTSYTETATGVPFDMVAIKGDSFTMGSPESEPQRSNDEVQHEVTLSDFYMGKYEVTQAEYKAIMGNNPSYFKGDNLPVEKVSWYDAVEFCNKLSEKAGLQPYYHIDKNTKDLNNKNENDDIKWTVTINKGVKGYRLPTESEWEYAARAKTNTPFAFGENITTDQANYDGNYPYNDNLKGEYLEKTVPVNSFKPNPWGLYNMHGNVYEWCWDWYHSYDTDISNNPTGYISGDYRVVRGGSWNDGAKSCRSAYRSYNRPSDRDNYIGFRLSRNR